MDRILYGAGRVGAFLWPDEPPARRKRRVYNLAVTGSEAERLPVFKLGSSPILCARPETLRAWIAEREKRRGGAA
jgi:hypothetical protein